MSDTVHQVVLEGYVDLGCIEENIQPGFLMRPQFLEFDCYDAILEDFVKDMGIDFSCGILSPEPKALPRIAPSGYDMAFIKRSFASAEASYKKDSHCRYAYFKLLLEYDTNTESAVAYQVLEKDLSERLKPLHI